MISLRIASLLVAIAVTTGCATNPLTGQQELSAAGIGAAVGVVAGGLLGAAVGDHRAAYAGAAIGAAIGGGTGYWLENKKRAERNLRDTGMAVSSEIEPVSGQHTLVIQASADVTFAPASAQLHSEAFYGLARVAESLRGMPGTVIEVVGHTDNQGSAIFNQALSDERARNVAAFLMAAGIAPGSIRTKGMGYEQPIASNASPEGRARNRRVEIRVSQNDVAGVR